MKFATFFILLTLLFTACGISSTSSPKPKSAQELLESSTSSLKPKSAQELFEVYVDLEQKFDPSVAELYADNALIKNTRRYPNGQVKVLEIPADKYKALIKTVMPVAKAKGDTNKYSEITYAPEGSRTRIKATRYSELKKYSSPISILTGPDTAGVWRIYEEITESKP